MGSAVAQVAVSVGLSAISALMNKSESKRKNPIKDEKPNTAASRGAWVPRIFGRERVGPVVCWVGDRTTKTITAAGGTEGQKGGGGAQGGAIKTVMYDESAWHVLCVGPAFALHEIYSDGKVIFEGPIDSLSHPSGTEVETSVGDFKIYWGEFDQPVSSYLADKIGRASRWPGVCYILWNQKELGQQPHWPALEYVVEVRPTLVGLGSSAPWIEEQTNKDPTKIYSVTGNVDGDVGTALFKVNGNQKSKFKPGGTFYLEGNAEDDGYYGIHKSAYSASTKKTHIYPDEELVGSDSSGTITVVNKTPISGWNAAHLIFELLYAGSPYGLKLDIPLFNFGSLEELGLKLADEGQPTHLAMTDGETVYDALGQVLADVGLMVSFHNGQWRFKLIRAPEGDLPIIPDDAILDPLPEIETNHLPSPSDRVIYEYKDRERKFRYFTIPYDDDGQATLADHKRQKKVELRTARDYTTAEKIADRRYQEDLSNGARFRLICNHAARLMYPGQAFVVPSINHVLRLTEIELDSLSGRCTLDCLVDYYGVPASDFLSEPGEAEPIYDTEPDLAFAAIEPSQYLDKNLKQSKELILLRIRASALVTSSSVYISDDDSTYDLTGEGSYAQTGGTLVDEFSADTFKYLDEGPVIDVLGPDIATVLDLSGKDSQWKSGKQHCVIVSDAGVEWCFLKRVTVLSATQVRLDGLIRARYDYPKLTHNAGAVVYIFQDEAYSTVKNSLIKGGATLYFKIQPKADSSLPLDEIVPYTIEVKGNSYRPPNPHSLHSTPYAGRKNLRKLNQDFRLRWVLRSSEHPNTGAGQQFAGAPHSYSKLEGEGYLVFKDDNGDVYRTEKLKNLKDLDAGNGKSESDFVDTFLYTVDEQITDGVHMMSPLSFELYIVKSGFKSDVISCTVEGVS